ncbi:MAG: DUF4097 domain-containing protein [Verrucomicrobia subdivision 3 bacterium]|nr:DUF4097 domain-containing protein [Limisphaerales bacterium]
MKTISAFLLAGCLAAFAETEEEISKRFTVQPGGKLIVDVDFGSINVSPGTGNEVAIDVFRKVKRGSKADEEAFLDERPVTFAQDGDAITVRSRADKSRRFSWRGSQSTEAKYTIRVPAQFNAQVKTSGGSISINELKGEVNARTSGGSLKFARLNGTLDGHTSGGSIRVTDCVGPIKVNTSGGGIDVQNASGKVEASTSGGSVSAQFASAPPEEVTLKTSGGSVTLTVPENAAFDLDASTSGGSVKSDLAVSTDGKPSRTHLKGPVNGGGKPVVLRTSGGSVRVKKA